MKIAMIGTGYVGLVTGACFSEYGLDVHCVDKDAGKVSMLNRGEMPIYEPGLQEIVVSNAEADRLHFTTDMAAAVAGARVVFIAVGTPETSDGDADMTYVFAAAREIAQALTGYTVVVTKSTVPVGTSRAVADIIRKTNPAADFDCASNPEFLREGAAVRDFMRPDRIVIGASADRAFKTLRRIYRPLHLIGTPIEEMSPESAELAKYAANSFLATKISFINEVADLCEAVSADVERVAVSMGHDSRIGARFLQPGPGYGGSCFPKDTKAFAATGRSLGRPQHVVEAAIAVNARRRQAMALRVAEACGGSVEGATIAVLGLTFKAGTDDLRESPALFIVPELQKLGATVRAFDPAGMAGAAAMLDGSTVFCEDAYDAAHEADAVVIVTEWSEFGALDLPRLHARMRQPVFVDLRNIYGGEEIADAGFFYHSIGRPDRAPIRRSFILGAAAE
jgi:UDPglucose 6-dehydrogenase